MNDPEKILQQVKLTEPSKTLDARMESLFAAAHAGTGHGTMRRAVPLWACVVLCGATALITILLVTDRTAPDEPAVEPGDGVAYRLIVVESTDDFPAHTFDLTQYDELRAVNRQSNIGVSVSGASLSETPGGPRSSNSEATEL